MTYVQAPLIACKFMAESAVPNPVRCQVEKILLQTAQARAGVLGGELPFFLTGIPLVLCGNDFLGVYLNCFCVSFFLDTQRTTEIHLR